jgi:hypothetical protein
MFRLWFGAISKAVDASFRDVVSEAHMPAIIRQFHSVLVNHLAVWSWRPGCVDADGYDLIQWRYLDLQDFAVVPSSGKIIMILNGHGSDLHIPLFGQLRDGLIHKLRRRGIGKP